MSPGLAGPTAKTVSRGPAIRLSVKGLRRSSEGIHLLLLTFMGPCANRAGRDLSDSSDGRTRRGRYARTQRKSKTSLRNSRKPTSEKGGSGFGRRLWASRHKDIV